MAQLRFRLPGDLPGAIEVVQRSSDTLTCRVSLSKDVGTISNLMLPAQAGINILIDEAYNTDRASTEDRIYRFIAEPSLKTSDLAGMPLSLTVLQSHGAEVTIVTTFPNNTGTRAIPARASPQLSSMIEDDDILLSPSKRSPFSPSLLQNKCNEVTETLPIHFDEIEDDDGFVLFDHSKFKTN